MKKLAALVVLLLCLVGVVSVHAEDMQVVTVNGFSIALPSSWISGEDNSEYRQSYFGVKEGSTSGGYVQVMWSAIEGVAPSDGDQTELDLLSEFANAIAGESPDDVSDFAFIRIHERIAIKAAFTFLRLSAEPPTKLLSVVGDGGIFSVLYMDTALHEAKRDIFFTRIINTIEVPATKSPQSINDLSYFTFSTRYMVLAGKHNILKDTEPLVVPLGDITMVGLPLVNITVKNDDSSVQSVMVRLDAEDTETVVAACCAIMAIEKSLNTLSLEELTGKTPFVEANDILKGVLDSRKLEMGSWTYSVFTDEGHLFFFIEKTN